MTVKADNNTIVKFQIFDASGNEIYKDVITRYCNGTQIVIMVFDLNDVSSLNDVMYWNTTLKQDHNISSDNTIFLLIGNKLDLLADSKINKKILKKDERSVASWNALEHHCVTEKAQGIAKLIGAHYAEISTKTGQNVKYVCSTITNLSSVKGHFHKKTDIHKDIREECVLF